MSRAKMQAAAELIRERRYNEARTILVTIQGNTKAQEWIRRIDEIAPPLPSVPFSTPARQQRLKPEPVSFLDFEEEKPKGKSKARKWADAIAGVFIVCAFLFVFANRDTSPMTPEQVREHLVSSLSYSSRARGMESIGYLPNGNVLVNYRTSEVTEAGFVQELIDIFAAVGRAENGRFPLNRVIIAVRSPLGIDVAAVEVDAQYIRQLRRGDISIAAFTDRLRITTF